MSELLATGAFQRKITREWARNLTGDELSVVYFIYDRTYAYNKVSETIPVRHFLEGIVDRDGEVISRGLNLTRSYLFLILAELKRLDLLHTSATTKIGKATEYSLNPVGDPSRLRPDGPPKKDWRQRTRAHIRWEKWREARGAPVSMPDETRRVHAGRDTPRPCRTGRASINKGYLNMRIRTGGTAEPPAGLASQAKAAAEKSGEARQRVKDKGNPSGCQKAWHDKMHECFPHASNPTWTTQQIGAVRHVVRRLPAKYKATAFFAFVVEAWDAILPAQFGWMKSGRPSYPEIKFVYRFLDKFVEAFIESQRTGLIPRAQRERPAPAANADELAKLKAENARLAAELAATQRKPAKPPTLAPSRRIALGRKRGPTDDTAAKRAGFKAWDE